MQQKTLLACLIGLVCSGQAMAQQMETAAINFDQETLRSLGINPDVSNYFSLPYPGMNIQKQDYSNYHSRKLYIHPFLQQRRLLRDHAHRHGAMPGLKPR